jgi:hypothetical protein
MESVRFLMLDNILFVIELKDLFVKLLLDVVHLRLAPNSSRVNRTMSNPPFNTNTLCVTPQGFEDLIEVPKSAEKLIVHCVPPVSGHMSKTIHSSVHITHAKLLERV